jgi:hypothetical protein
MKDIRGKELFTGDIVLTFTESYSVDYLTAVVSDQFASYSDGTHIEHKSHSPFVMGIKNVNLDEGEWMILKVKDWSDCIDGEHWKEYGFNYKCEDAPNSH